MRPEKLYRKALLAGCLLAGCLLAMICGAAEYDTADQVVIRKAERKLLLMKDGRVLRTMDVALGLLPEGDKKAEGDFHTPEGSYKLLNRNPASEFFLSIQVSYPNEVDMLEAQKLGIDPGGEIMIHGQPNSPRHSVEYYRQTDWTDGCIAVSNADMVDIWLMTSADTPITISP